MARQGKDSLKEAKLTSGMLASMERTATTRKDGAALRLIKAIRDAWRERDEAVGSLELERAEWERLAKLKAEEAERGERAFEGREKVLVVVRYDGFVEAYAESWLDVRVICEAVLDEEEDLERKMPGCYRDLYVPGFLRSTGISALRPEITDLEILKLMEYEARLECLSKLEALEKRP